MIDMDVPGQITSVDELAAMFPAPSKGVLAKQIDHIDEHCRAFVSHSPFLAMGTTNPDGTGDVSPKGGMPGFVRVLDDHTLAWGELPGNNRLDGYRNVVRDPRIGLLFLIPGVDETLRVNGTACLSRDPGLLDATAVGVDATKRRAPLCIVVNVTEAFVHCAKAFRRSQLWQHRHWPSAHGVPDAACMISAHVGLPPGGETALREMLEENYRTTLWNDDTETGRNGPSSDSSSES
jgi:uncharacterized protein